MTREKTNSKLQFFKADFKSDTPVSYVGGVNAGFPSPADDYLDVKIDLNQELVQNPEATFYARVRGNSMIEAGLNDGDVLVIDRSLEAGNNSIAVCFLDGEFTVKRIKIEKDFCWLVPENKEFSPIKVTSENNFMIWGIVAYVIKKV